MENHLQRNSFHPYSKLELLARQVVEGFITGLHKSPFHGFSVEFAEHRLYNSGESTRHIDWKLYGKTDKMFVKRYEEETNLRCHIIIDSSSSMFIPFNEKVNLDDQSKIVFSVKAAAALMVLLHRQRDAFGLSFFSENVDLHSQSRSSETHLRLLFSYLEMILSNYNPKKLNKTNTAKALHEIAEKIHQRSLVVLFSDMFDSSEDEDELLSALQHLRHNKHEVIVFHVVDKKAEIDFDFSNRPIKFIDAESGEILKLNPRDVRESYIKRMAEFNAKIKLNCGKFNIDLVAADVNEGINNVLLPYLLKRQKML